MSKSKKPAKRESDVLEYVQATKPCRVDRDKGVIYGVKVVGFKSKNGGVYPRACLEAAQTMYEGARCNLNHPRRDAPGVDRDVEDRFGIFHNPRIGEDGAYADLHYLKSHPFAQQACEAAESMPEVFGFSHNAKTIQVPDGNGGIIHESITRVRSVDLVADPATTSSIFESETMNDPHTQGMAGDDAVPPDDLGLGGGDASGPVDAAIDALLAKYMPDIKASSDKGARKSLLDDMKKKILAVLDALSDEQEPEPEEAPPEDNPFPSEGEGESSPESIGPEEGEPEEPPQEPTTPDYEIALNVLESVGVQPTAVRIRALIKADEKDRQALAESWPKVGAAAQAVAKPRSSSVMESQRDAAVVPSPTFTEEDLKDDAMLLFSSR
jgi:ribosomal protein L12E/L44/L45/RPP1/RPP2